MSESMQSMRSDIGQSPAGGAFQRPRQCLAGFEHINRYWDRQNNIVAAKIMPGEYYVTAEDEVIVTVLGSCVSACIRDKFFGIGGMNHFMLPVSGENASSRLRRIDSEETRYGNYAMEALINSILKNGGRKENLEIKIFGGGNILQHMTNVGSRNVKFVREFIATEELNLIAEDVGDIYPRKVYFFPKSGRVMLKKLKSLKNETVFERETAYLHELKKKPIEGEIDLF